MADRWVEVSKLVVEAGGFALAIFTGWQGLKRAHQDRKAALKQAELDLRWRQTVEARETILKLTQNPGARNAMTLLDWSNRFYTIREGLRERISWDEMHLALRTTRGKFHPKETFVRDCFDDLLDQLQLIQQQVDNGLFRIGDVLYPVGYYSALMHHPKNWPYVEPFLDHYQYPLAKRLIINTAVPFEGKTQKAEFNRFFEMVREAQHEIAPESPLE